MSELTPCPECQRHVRKSETACPFCGEALSLSHLPPHALPRTRLGRAATFAFGATLVGATALVGCGGESEEGKKEGGGGTAAGGTSQAGSSAGGSGAGQSVGGTGTGPVYGAPAGGEVGDSGGSSAGTAAGLAGSIAIYGAPAAGSGNVAGMAGVPLYGAAPAD